MDNGQKIVNDIRGGVLDINAQELFYPLVLKGLLVNLRDCIKIRGNVVPHYITHMGDDRLWLEMRGYDNSIEPIQISNEDNIYTITPRCNVSPGGLSFDVAQLTSPYSIGQCQLNTEEGVYTLKGEFRRIPVKMTCDLKYQTDSYTDLMELVQYVSAHLAFIRTYNIMYLGNLIKCSYKIPEAFDGEHAVDLDGSFTDTRTHQMSLSIEIETNIPVFSNKTMMLADKIITKTQGNLYTKVNEE
jgi:hypothetical protein